MTRPGVAGSLALIGALACDAPPRGEALFVVDTDMPVPKIVDTLRVDIYSADGSTWLVSRDIRLSDPKQWPASFSVYATDTSIGGSALVRLRGYRSEYVEDYRGEGMGRRGRPARDDDQSIAFERHELHGRVHRQQFRKRLHELRPAHEQAARHGDHDHLHERHRGDARRQS